MLSRVVDKYRITTIISVSSGVIPEVASFLVIGEPTDFTDAIVNDGVIGPISTQTNQYTTVMSE